MMQPSHTTHLTFKPTLRWAYARDPEGYFQEYGVWSGSQPPTLRRHFHGEAQFTLVTAGLRSFRIGDDLFSVPPGCVLYIPANQPHQGMPHFEPGARCLNAYMANCRLGPEPFVGDLSMPDIATRDPHDLLWALARYIDMLPPHRSSHEPAQRTFDIGGMRGPMSAIASVYGVGREAFTRRFSREMEISPHAFRLVRRLNDGRARLREGEDIATVAADLEFADQSHFTRLFRQAFGVSPLAYRKGFDRSQTFQTA